ncbi:archease [candidate division TA06 bacterium]|nr:archease [candidate division TA06 bacterium]
MDYETFEHDADIGIRGFGKTLEEAFENGARAMSSIMVDLETVDPKVTKEIECEADDQEALFVTWLNQIRALLDIDGMVFSKFEVEIVGNRLKGWAKGEVLDYQKHGLGEDVKAATYHLLKVEKNDVYMVQCIIDL